MWIHSLLSLFSSLFSSHAHVSARVAPGICNTTLGASSATQLDKSPAAMRLCGCVLKEQISLYFHFFSHVMCLFEMHMCGTSFSPFHEVMSTRCSNPIQFIHYYALIRRCPRHFSFFKLNFVLCLCIFELSPTFFFFCMVSWLVLNFVFHFLPSFPSSICWTIFYLFNLEGCFIGMTNVDVHISEDLKRE